MVEHGTQTLHTAYRLPSGHWAIRWATGGHIGTEDTCRRYQTKFASILNAAKPEHRAWLATRLDSSDLG